MILTGAAFDMWVEWSAQDVEYRIARDVQNASDLLLSGECLDTHAPLTEPEDEAA